MTYTNDIEGYCGQPELNWLHEQSKFHPVIVEIGSYRGRSTTALCDGCPGMVFAVDPWEGQNFTFFIRNLGVRKNLWPMRQRSLDARKEFAEKSVDMVFIDGDHSYEAVRDDILHWLPACKTLICGHDYTDDGIGHWPGVVQAANEAFGVDRVEHLETIWAVRL